MDYFSPVFRKTNYQNKTCPAINLKILIDQKILKYCHMLCLELEQLLTERVDMQTFIQNMAPLEYAGPWPNHVIGKHCLIMIDHSRMISCFLNSGINISSPSVCSLYLQACNYTVTIIGGQATVYNNVAMCCQPSHAHNDVMLDCIKQALKV